MTGIVLPGDGRDGLRLLTEWVPECLIPLAGKPLLEHQIELFVRNGITRIVVVVVERLYDVEEYFRQGERWGVSLRFVLAGADMAVSTWLELALDGADEEPAVVITATTTPHISLSALRGEFESAGADLLVTVVEGEPDDGRHCSPLIIRPQRYPRIVAARQGGHCDDLAAAARDVGMAVVSSPLAASFVVRTLDDYLEANGAILRCEWEGIIIPAPEREPGIWIGRNTRLAPSVSLVPPVFIGGNCQIRGDVTLANAVIGDRVVIDRQASVNGSVVLGATYVGSHTEVSRSVVRKNSIINVERRIKVAVTDPIILADLAEVIPDDQKERVLDLATASILLLLFAPVLIPLLLADLLVPPLKLVSRERCYGNREVPTLSGAFLKKPFTLLQFRFGPLILKKLPGLFSVIRGDLAMVGASPLTDEELGEVVGKWQELLQDNTRGLFHVWEAEGDSTLSFEEKLVMENYYAVIRTLREDAKILKKIMTS